MLRNTIGLCLACVQVSLTVGQDAGVGPSTSAAEGPVRALWGSATSDSLDLLAMSSVRKELRLADVQARLIEDLTADVRDQRRKVYAEYFRQLVRSPAGQRSQLKQQTDQRILEIDRNLQDVLQVIIEPHQVERLNQLRLQRSGPGVLVEPQWVERLGLAAAQQVQIRRILTRPPDRKTPKSPATAAAERSAFDVLYAPGDDSWLDPAALRKDQERRNAEILAVLNAEQRRTWESLLGKEFEFPRENPASAAGHPGDNDPGPQAAKPNDP